MKQNICVLRPAIVIENLSHKKALELMKRANKLDAAKYLTFSIYASDKTPKSNWSLMYLPKQACEKFREKPDGFILDLVDKEKEE